MNGRGSELDEGTWEGENCVAVEFSLTTVGVTDGDLGMKGKDV